MAAEAELEREGGYYDEDGQFFPDEPVIQQQQTAQQKQLEQQKQQQQKAEKDIKAAQDAAKAAGDAAKNLFGGVTSLGGSLLGKAASTITKPQQQQQQQKAQQQPQLGRTSSVKSETRGGESESEDSKGEKRVTFGPDIVEEDDVPLERRDHRPKFVKHINKTRTMSGKQKWEWAFDRIIQVGTPNFKVQGPYSQSNRPKVLFEETFKCKKVSSKTQFYSLFFKQSGILAAQVTNGPQKKIFHI
jgi:hypothetical protein